MQDNEVEKPRYAQNRHRPTLAGSEEYCDTALVSKRSEENAECPLEQAAASREGTSERKGESGAPEKATTALPPPTSFLSSASLAHPLV
jgi:hypothetical protein